MPSKLPYGRTIREANLDEFTFEGSTALDLAVIEALSNRKARLINVEDRYKNVVVQFVVIPGGLHESKSRVAHKANTNSTNRDSRIVAKGTNSIPDSQEAGATS